MLAHSLTLSLPLSFMLCLSSGIVYLAKEFEPEKMDPRLTKCCDKELAEKVPPSVLLHKSGGERTFPCKSYFVPPKNIFAFPVC